MNRAHRCFVLAESVRLPGQAWACSLTSQSAIVEAMASLRTYDVLAAYLAASAVGDAIPMPFVTQVLDAIDFPPRYRWIFAPIKAAAAIGLLSARWSPGLTRLTTAMLTIYFTLAVGFHVKARDLSVAALGAAANTAIFAALTLKEPAVADVRAVRS